MKKFLLHTILLILGLYFFSKAQNPYSKNFIDSSKIILKECFRKKNTECYVRNCIGISNAFMYLGKQDSALRYLNNIKASNSLNITSNFELNNQLSIVYAAKGLYFSSLQYAYKSLFYSEKLKDSLSIAQSYYLLASNDGLLNRNQEALFWYSKALPIYKSKKKFYKYYHIVNNIANCHKRLHNLNKAIKLYQVALAYNLKTDNKFWQAILFSNMGETYLEAKKFKKALFFLRKALEINKLRADTLSMLNDNLAMTSALLQTGNASEALKFAKESQKILSTRNIDDENMRLSKLFSEIYEKKYDYSSAIDYLKKYNNLKEKKYENELEKKIASQKIDYELLNEKQKSENQKTTIDLQNKNNNFLKGIAVLLLILTILIFYSYQNQKKQNKIINTQSEQIKENNLQLEQKVVQRTSELMVANQNLLSKNDEIENALYLGKKQERNQIAGQLHDNLGGYLSAIRYNLMALDSERLENNEKKIFDNISKMINTAHDEVRYLSHNMIPKDLEDEGIVFCLTKLAKQLSETGKIEFSYQGPKILKIDLKTEYELYSICLELTNNILKHAKATKAGYLIETKEYKKTIYVFDNGIGLQDSENGFGLNNIKTKLHKINASLSFDSRLPANFKDYSTVVKIEL